MERTKKTALITGASSGFGPEFARLFAQDGYDVVLVARSEEPMNRLASELKYHYGVEATVLPKDLTQPQAADEIYGECQQRGIQVSALVNDAGVGWHGEFVQTDLRKELDIIQLNVVSLVHLTKLFVKDMVAHNEGKILQLGSTLSVIPTPMMSIYGATKAFVLSFSEALQNELNGTNVTLTVLMPGASDTNFFRTADAADTVVAQDTTLSSPQEVAKAGYEGLMAGKAKVIPGFKNKLQAQSSGITPTPVLTATMRKLMAKKGESTNGNGHSEESSQTTQRSLIAAATLVIGLAAWLYIKDRYDL
jgi:hypothetical protein